MNAGESPEVSGVARFRVSIEVSVPEPAGVVEVTRRLTRCLDLGDEAVILYVEVAES